MKKLFGSFAIAVLAAGSLFGETLAKKAFYTIEKLPRELTWTVRPGHDIEFSIEENGTTGYVWSASYDPRICKVELDHKGPGKTKLAGAPGRVEVEIKPLSDAPAVVVLKYTRPFEPDAAPAATVSCIVSRQAQAAAVQPTAPTPVKADVDIVSMPELRDDAVYKFADVPSDMMARLPIGQDIEFELREPHDGSKWRLINYDHNMCKVEFKNKSGGWFWKPAKAEVEIKGLRPGQTVVEFAAGSKVLRCHMIFI